MPLVSFGRIYTHTSLLPMPGSELFWEFLVDLGRAEGGCGGRCKEVIIRANPNLIKEIQLTVWEAREYLTGSGRTAQITVQTENHLITYYCYCSASDYHHITTTFTLRNFTNISPSLFWDPDNHSNRQCRKDGWMDMDINNK